MQIDTKKIKYREIEDDLIVLALNGEFEVIAHGCNCFCKMKRGLAYQMNTAFKCNDSSIYKKENEIFKGDISKLGTIEWAYSTKLVSCKSNGSYLKVVNMYTQYYYSDKSKPFDYEAFTSCLRTLNDSFSGKTIGLPKIGTGLAGGDWNIVKEIIQQELKDCYVTVVNFKDTDEDLYENYGYFI